MPGSGRIRGTPGGGSRFALDERMLLEGTCAEGHDLVCVLQDGHLSGVQSNGKLLDRCPICGGKPYLALESGTLAVAAPSGIVPPVIVPRRHG